MKLLFTFLAFLAGTFLFSQDNSNSFEKQSSVFSFVENKGQIYDQNYKSNPEVLYLLNMPGLNVQLKKNGFSYDIYEKEIIKSEKTDIHSISQKSKDIEHEAFNMQIHRVDFEFLNFNSNFEKSVSGQTQGVENYYLEHLPNGIHGIKSYEKVVYKKFYNNIDLEFVSKNDTLKPFEYNFILHPGAKLEDIQFKINGADNFLNEGSIDIQVQFGTIKETIPASWFENKERQKSVEIEFNQIGSSIYGLKFKDENSKSDLKESKLVIDPVPVRQWGTYYGVNGVFAYSFVYSLKYFQNGVYVVGSAEKNGMATSGTFQSSFKGTVDGYLAKFSDEGQRIWATYCGTSGFEILSDVDVFDLNNIYVAGSQTGPVGTLATAGAFQTIPDNQFQLNEGLIMKFSENGQRVWGTYYGGMRNDYFTAIKVDKNNQFIYIGGVSGSSDMATPGSFQTVDNVGFNSEAGFLTKFDTDGSRIWATYYSGNQSDGIGDLIIDNDDNIIFGGIARSTNGISTLNDYFGSYGDSYLAKFTPDGERLWGMYIGGDGFDYAKAIAVNSNNEIVISGQTTSTDLATSGVFLENFLTTGQFQEYSGFVVKVSPIGEKLWGSYIGGYKETWVTDVKFNDQNEILITGRTESNSHIASPNGYDPTLSGLSNAYVVKLSPNGQRVWGTYYGGNHGVGYAYTIDLYEKDIYIAGTTTFQYGIATPDTYQPTQPVLGDYNAFIAKFKDCERDTSIEITGTNCEGDTIELTASGGISYEWHGPNGFIGNGSSITINNLNASNSGEYFVFIENGDCSEVKSTIIEVGGENAPVPDITNLPNINAVCSVTIIPPTATDDCLGTITATTTSPLFYDIPGEYWISWLFEDNFGNQIYQEQLIILASGDDFMIASIPLTICDEVSPTYNLNLVEPDITEGENVLFNYYETLEDMTNNNPIATPGNYTNVNGLSQVFVKGSIADCSDYTSIQLQTTPLPTANSLSPTVCDNDDDGTSEIILNQYINQINPNSDVIISFYEDASMTLMIDPNVNFSVSEGDVIYVKIQTGNCENESTITIVLGDYTLNSISNFEVCVDDINVPYTFNLNEKSAEIAAVLDVNSNSIKFYDSLQNARIGNASLNSNFPIQNNPQTIYASFDNVSGCPDIVSFDLILNQNPIFEMNDFYQKCIGKPITINAPSGFDYVWSTGDTLQEISIENEGEYYVEISNGNCSITQEITVEDFQPIAFEHTYENSILNLNIPNDSNLEFSLNGIFWQNSPLFLNLDPGEYEVWIRTQTGCLQNKTITLYDKIPNFISPNGDGHNDLWDVSFLREVLDVRIFDRYGKTIFYNKGTQIVPWTGIYLGGQLPSGNYWYIIKFINGDQLNGSILLKNY